VTDKMLIERGFEHTGGKIYPTITVTMPPCDTNDDAAWTERNNLAGKIATLLAAPPHAPSEHVGDINVVELNGDDLIITSDLVERAVRSLEPAGEEVELDAYSYGLLNDWGGGNVEWWWDYIRHEIGAAHDHYQDQHQRIVEGLNAVIDRKNRRIHDFANEVIKLEAFIAEIESALVTKNHEAHDLEIDNRQLKAEVEQLKARIVWLECEAKCDGKVVLPEPRFQRVAWDYSDGWNDCIDEVQRLNGAKPCS